MPGRGFTQSVVSYPERGNDGDRRYRGNTTGKIVEDFLFTYHTDRGALFVDPMEGSGTSGDVARRLGIAYRGFDLKDGFDATAMDLRAQLPEEAGSAFLHPAYAGMIRYSGPGGMWGEAIHPADLSSKGKDVDAFVEMLQAVLQNVYAALRPGGVYAVLLGSWRVNGRYEHLPARMLSVAPGTLIDEILKIQHNCTSDRTSYNGNFVRIQHETLLVFRRDADGSVIGMFAEMLGRIEHQKRATWKSFVLGLTRVGERVTLAEMYAWANGSDRRLTNRHVKAKVRQTLQYLESDGRFARIARGEYERVA